LIAEETRHGLDFWVDEVKTRLRTLVLLPAKMDTLLSRLEHGDLAVRIPEVDRRVRQLERATRQLVASILFFALFLGGIQLYLAGQSPLWELLLAGAGLSLVWLLMTGRRP
jgi:hypothetical protein